MGMTFGRTAKFILGVLLLLVGIVALLTPFTPGSWLIFVGAELLGIRTLIRLRKKVGRTTEAAADAVKDAASDTVKSAGDALPR